MIKILITFLVTTAFVTGVTAQSIVEHTYPLNDGPDKNPMKGWNSGWWNVNDLASVGFQYLSWKNFEPTDDNFNFDAVEDVINRPGSINKHLILRLFTDWHGNDSISNAGPSWLYSDYGVGRFVDDDGRYITDYNDPNYISEVMEAIDTLAGHFDIDPRIYAFQLGVLGYWGEWHTWGYDDPDFEIDSTTKVQILDAYTSSFSNKKLMGRYPWDEVLALDNTIGYHNDFFKPFNGHSDDFNETVSETGKWLNGPIGGEVPPLDSIAEADFISDAYEGPEGLNMINTGHYSTMQSGPRSCEDDPGSVACAGYMAMHRKMGYNYQIQTALFADTLEVSDSLFIELNISNIGVAPMYYDWDVQFALLNELGEVVEVFETPFNLKTILSDDMIYAISTTVDIASIPLDDYKLAVRIIQPNSDEDKDVAWALDARNTYVLLSNDLPIIDGFWNAENALIGGWSILGNITVEASSVSLKDQNLADYGMKIYPNPATDQLNIEINEAVKLNAIEIYDNTGRLVATYNIEASGTTKGIDISHLSSGVYNVVIHTETGDLQTILLKD